MLIRVREADLANELCSFFYLIKNVLKIIFLTKKLLLSVKETGSARGENKVEIFYSLYSVFRI